MISSQTMKNIKENCLKITMLILQNRLERYVLKDKFLFRKTITFNKNWKLLCPIGVGYFHVVISSRIYCASHCISADFICGQNRNSTASGAAGHKTRELCKVSKQLLWSGPNRDKKNTEKEVRNLISTSENNSSVPLQILRDLEGLLPSRFTNHWTGSTKSREDLSYLLLPEKWGFY